MNGFREIVNGLKSLGISQQYPVIAHINPAIIKEIQGGTKTLLGGFLTATDNLVLPAFTTRTQVIPKPARKITQLFMEAEEKTNLQAEIFSEDLSADEPYREMAEEFLHYPKIKRSSHPILSFVGLGLNSAMASQNNSEPYAPIKSLMDMNGMVILAGVDQTWNFSLHYAEYLAGRKQFTRWGLTKEGIQECTPFPGCPDGFIKINHRMEENKAEINLANTTWQAFSVQQLIEIAVNTIKKDPFSLLCNRLKCERCNAVRQVIRNG